MRNHIENQIFFYRKIKKIKKINKQQQKKLKKKTHHVLHTQNQLD